MRLLGLLAAGIFVWAQGALAQVRTIPEQAKAGEIRHVQDMIVSIDGVALRLAPGAQIRDQSNRLVVPSSVPPGAKVRYLLSGEGLVRQVWILTPEEAPKPVEAAKPKPAEGAQ